MVCGKVFEEFYRKKSKIFWLKVGDQNISFFYVFLKVRRIKFIIVQWDDEFGNILIVDKDIVNIFVKFFIRMFGESFFREKRISNFIINYGGKLII